MSKKTKVKLEAISDQLNEIIARLTVLSPNPEILQIKESLIMETNKIDEIIDFLD